MKTTYSNLNPCLSEVYYPGQRAYLKFNGFDTCFNCLTGFIYTLSGERKQSKFNRIDYKFNIFYPNGILMGNSLFHSNQSYNQWFLRYNCTDSTKFFTYPFDFTSFYDSTGKLTFNGDSGYVKLLGSHGKPVYEANYRDSVKNGLYKGYSPTGKLTETGKYVNGLKQGVWYSGSLDGKVDWELMCGQNFGQASQSNKFDGFVNLQINEYDKGAIIKSQQINYKR